MTHTGEESTTAQGKPRRWWTLAVLLVLISVTLGLLGLDRDTAPSMAPTPVPGTTEPAPDNRPSPAAPPTSPNPPVRLKIPAIGVNTPLLRLGLNKDRSVQVPTDEHADKAGWFKLGTEPGRHGSAVILGHVDSTRGPAVFFRLKTLKPGTQFTVTRKDRTVATFRVLRVVTYPNERFPAKKVYAGSPTKTLLNLVTCGGEYDPAKGGYQSNVVAYSQLVMISPASHQK